MNQRQADGREIRIVTLRKDRNNIKNSTTFPLLMPISGQYRNKDFIYVRFQDEPDSPPVLGQIYSCYTYPNLDGVSDGLLSLITGKTNPADNRAELAAAYRGRPEIANKPFGILLIEKI